MNTTRKNWIKPAVTLFVMFLLVWLSPTTAIDPWNLINPKKIATLIMALTFIQAMGSVMTQALGAGAGAIITGFFGGLISSTATTASLARKSKSSEQSETSTEILTFLSATAAMLLEGATLLLLGTKEIHYTLLLMFVGPILAIAIMIFSQSQKIASRDLKIENIAFKIFPILKLTAFIVSVLALSKLLQNIFGQEGLVVLTFLVSLFEIHGSVIANIQLHDAGAVSVRLLGSLLATSIFASCLSKIFLISTIGSSSLRSQVVKSTFILIFSLLLGWLLFLGLT